MDCGKHYTRRNFEICSLHHILGAYADKIKGNARRGKIIKAFRRYNFHKNKPLVDVYVKDRKIFI
jgi:hypothetical protein